MHLLHEYERNRDPACCYAQKKTSSSLYTREVTAPEFYMGGKWCVGLMGSINNFQPYRKQTAWTQTLSHAT